MLFRGDYDEKRQFTRMEVDCPALIRIDGEAASHHAVVKDLSATGLQLSCADALPVGAKVEVEMTPEKQIVPPLQAKAEVLRCDEMAEGGYLVGVQILEMLPGL